MSGRICRFDSTGRSIPREERARRGKKKGNSSSGGKKGKKGGGGGGGGSQGKKGKKGKGGKGGMGGGGGGGGGGGTFGDSDDTACDACSAGGNAPKMIRFKIKSYTASASTSSAQPTDNNRGTIECPEGGTDKPSTWCAMQPVTGDSGDGTAGCPSVFTYAETDFLGYDARWSTLDPTQTPAPELSGYVTPSTSELWLDRSDFAGLAQGTIKTTQSTRPDESFFRDQSGDTIDTSCEPFAINFRCWDADDATEAPLPTHYTTYADYNGGRTSTGGHNGAQSFAHIMNGTLAVVHNHGRPLPDRLRCGIKGPRELCFGPPAPLDRSTSSNEILTATTTGRNPTGEGPCVGTNNGVLYRAINFDETDPNTYTCWTDDADKFPNNSPAYCDSCVSNDITDDACNQNDVCYAAVSGETCEERECTKSDFESLRSACNAVDTCAFVPDRFGKYKCVHNYPCQGRRIELGAPGVRSCGMPGLHDIGFRHDTSATSSINENVHLDRPYANPEYANECWETDPNYVDEFCTGPTCTLPRRTADDDADLFPSSIYGSHQDKIPQQWDYTQSGAFSNIFQADPNIATENLFAESISFDRSIQAKPHKVQTSTPPGGGSPIDPTPGTDVESYTDNNAKQYVLESVGFTPLSDIEAKKHGRNLVSFAIGGPATSTLPTVTPFSYAAALYDNTLFEALNGSARFEHPPPEMYPDCVDNNIGTYFTGTSPDCTTTTDTTADSPRSPIRKTSHYGGQGSGICYPVHSSVGVPFGTNSGADPTRSVRKDGRYVFQTFEEKHLPSTYDPYFNQELTLDLRCDGTHASSTLAVGQSWGMFEIDGFVRDDGTADYQCGTCDGADPSLNAVCVGDNPSTDTHNPSQNVCNFESADDIFVQSSCPVPPQECVICGEPTPQLGNEKGRLTELTFEWTSFGSVVELDSTNFDADGNSVQFSSVVDGKQTIVVSPAGDAFGANTLFTAFEESVNLHTSCSQPIYLGLGLSFLRGELELTGFRVEGRDTGATRTDSDCDPPTDPPVENRESCTCGFVKTKSEDTFLTDVGEDTTFVEGTCFMNGRRGPDLNRVDDPKKCCPHYWVTCAALTSLRSGNPSDVGASSVNGNNFMDYLSDDGSNPATCIDSWGDGCESNAIASAEQALQNMGVQSAVPNCNTRTIAGSSQPDYFGPSRIPGCCGYETGLFIDKKTVNQDGTTLVSLQLNLPFYCYSDEALNKLYTGNGRVPQSDTETCSDNPPDATELAQLTADSCPVTSASSLLGHNQNSKVGLASYSLVAIVAATTLLIGAAAIVHSRNSALSRWGQRQDESIEIEMSVDSPLNAYNGNFTETSFAQMTHEQFTETIRRPDVAPEILY